MTEKNKELPRHELLKQQKENAEHFRDVSQDIAEGIKNLVRGSQGQNIEEDPFSGLIHIKDPKERARLTPGEIYRHSFLRVLEKEGPGFEIFGDIANIEDTYSITKNGEQWLHAVEILRSRSQGPNTVVNTTLPGGAPAQEPKKRGFFSRLRGGSNNNETE